MYGEGYAQAAASGTNFLSNIFSTSMNYAMQEKINKLNYKMFKEAQAREDTAIQRRVKDLEAAGINRVLAAGQPAQTMPPIKLDAPKMNLKLDALGQLAQSAMIDKTIEENKLLQMQQKKVNADRLDKLTDYRIKKRDLGIATKRKMPFKFLNDRYTNYIYQIDQKTKEVENRMRKNSSVADRYFKLRDKWRYMQQNPQKYINKNKIFNYGVNP